MKRFFVMLHKTLLDPLILLWPATMATTRSSRVTRIPSFIDEILYYNIEAIGILSAVPYLIYCGVNSSVGFAVDHILDHKLLQLLQVRKAVTSCSVPCAY